MENRFETPLYDQPLNSPRERRIERTEARGQMSIDLLLLFSINKAVPLWMKLNNEVMAEEFIRTLGGSLALILAVPISILVA